MSRQLKIMIPDELDPLLAATASVRGVTSQSVILSILAEHYAIDIEPPRRGVRRTRRDSTDSPVLPSADDPD